MKKIIVLLLLVAVGAGCYFLVFLKPAAYILNVAKCHIHTKQVLPQFCKSLLFLSAFANSILPHVILKWKDILLVMLRSSKKQRLEDRLLTSRSTEFR